jgi:hypothetical protein
MNDRDREILVIAQEECAEVIQEISKIFRFGIDNTHKSGVKHRDVLEMEIGDLQCMINLLIEHKIVSKNGVDVAVGIKQQKLKKWSKIYD